MGVFGTIVCLSYKVESAWPLIQLLFDLYKIKQPYYKKDQISLAWLGVVSFLPSFPQFQEYLVFLNCTSVGSPAKYTIHTEKAYNINILDACIFISRRYWKVSLCNCDCLSIMQQHNTELLVDMVKQQFKRNMLETDPEKIQKMKDE